MSDLPADYDHCVMIWASMNEEAQPDENVGVGYVVYEGYLTKLFTKNRLSIPYYTKVMRLLQRMDCCRQLRRGGGSAPSRWLMVQPPTPALWNMINKTASSINGMPKDVALQQQIRDLADRVSALEERLANA